MKDSQAIREVISFAIEGMCGCNKGSALNGHTKACMASGYKSLFKRALRVADKLDKKHPLTKKQFVSARCWDL